MKWQLLAGPVVVAALCVLALLAINPGHGDQFDAAAAQEAARNWTGHQPTDAPRRHGDGWEVDVRRADGSIVEVNLGPRLELIELDEELGPGGTLAHDEVLGRERERAIAVVHAEGVSGVVRSVERERDWSIEVDVVRPDQSVVEVELDASLRVTGIDHEEIGDE